MAQIALNYNQLPHELDEEQIRDYLWMLKKPLSLQKLLQALRLLFRLVELQQYTGDFSQATIRVV